METGFFAGNPNVSDQIAHVEEVPPRPSVLEVPRHGFHPLLQSQLNQLGVDALYSHQARAYDAVLDGKDIVVVTGTNSGKTFCYNLPAIQMSLTEPACRGLYLFPTKALAQDQLSRLNALIPDSRVVTATYDGDTPKSQRSPIRKLAHILLTNPDMLHVGILPSHDLWAKFFKSLRLIVIDEMHVYRGVFGSNVGNVLRRLLRLCEWHHSRPQIVACSATIGNPRELFQRLTGREPMLIDEDGSPSGKRTFVFFNPPLVGAGARLSANVATSELVAGLAEGGVRTLAFGRSRVSAELVLRYTRKRIESGGLISPSSDSYRAGYTPKERRDIEQKLFSGDLLALSATNAMELGVDVGALDAVVINGYPGTSSSFWQQAGRAGRGTRDGLAIFVAHDDPLEQFLIRKPSMLLNARNESVAANPANPQILSRHLLCAAHERPISPHELSLFGDKALDVAEQLDRSGELVFRGGMFFYPSYDPPAFKVNIRGGGGEQVRLYLDGVELGTMDRWRAMTSAHAGAIYLHRGQSFLVESLDLEANRADVVPFEATYYTQSIVQSVISPHVTLHEIGLEKGNAGLVGVSVTDMVIGYRKRSIDGDTILSVEPLSFPPETYDTLAVRFDLPAAASEEDMAASACGAHGIEHALMAVAPLLAGCDRGDLGSAWYGVFHDTMRPAVFVFDKTPGGVGLAEKLYDSLIGWARAAEQLLASCDCVDGCPACLLSSRCEIANDALDKRATQDILRGLR